MLPCVLHFQVLEGVETHTIEHKNNVCHSGTVISVDLDKITPITVFDPNHSPNFEYESMIPGDKRWL